MRDARIAYNGSIGSHVLGLLEDALWPGVFRFERGAPDRSPVEFAEDGVFAAFEGHCE